MTVSPYKTMVDVLKISVNYHKQRARSIVHKSLQNNDLHMQINLTFREKAAIIVV
jgi:hypothetical protein